MRISGMQKKVEWGQGPFHFMGTVEIVGRERDGHMKVKIIEVISQGERTSFHGGLIVIIDKAYLGFRHR